MLLKPVFQSPAKVNLISEDSRNYRLTLLVTLFSTVFVLFMLQFMFSASSLKQKLDALVLKRNKVEMIDEK